MKLPSGKVTKSVAGGLDSFQGLLDELRGSSFTGYIAILLDKEDAKSKGQVVMKDGQPALADYEYKGSESIGTGAVNHIVSDGLNSGASIEVHANVDVDIIIDFNTDAQVSPSDFNLAAKAKEIQEAERKAKEEAERRAKEQKRRDELTQQMNEWRTSGYIVQKLESVIDSPLTEVENTFKAFGQNIEKLMELDKKLGSLNTKGFESKLDSIEMKLNDPDKIAELEKEINDLEKQINTRSKKEAELRKKIENWKNSGYNVSRLESTLESDFARAWDEIAGFMDALQKLKEYEDRLKKLETVGFEPMVEYIEANLKNPEAISELEQQFSDLEMRIKDAQERKEVLQKQIDEWASQGYNTKRFANIKKEALENVEQMIMEYDQDLHSLNELREQFEALDKADIKAEASALESKFNDPDNIAQLTDELQKLVSKLEQIEEKKKGLIEQVEEWKNLGYNIVSLEPKIKGAEIAQIERAVKDFEQKVGKLRGYEAVLDDMNLVGFESEGDAMRGKLMDPSNILEIDKDLKALKKKVEASEKKREELKKRVEGWKKEGFVVDSIEILLDGDLKVAWEAFTTMMDQIQLLKTLKEKLKGMDVTGYEGEAESFTNQLNDPSLASNLEAEINELDEKVKAEKARRAEIKKQVDEWKKEGFQLEILDEKLKGGLDDLESSFSEFTASIDRIKEYQKQVMALKTSTYFDELKSLKDKMKNPTLVDEVDRDFSELSNKVAEEVKIREELRTQMDAWKKDGFVVTSMEKAINGNINEARKASTNLSDTFNKILEYRHKINQMDLRDFENDKKKFIELSNDPANIEKLEADMNSLLEKVKTQSKARENLIAKLDGWRSQGLDVEELDKVKDEKFSLMDSTFKKFEDDLEKLMELQKKLTGKAATPASVAGGAKAQAPAQAGGGAAAAAAPAAPKSLAAAPAPEKEKPKAGPDTSATDEEGKKLFSEFKLNKDFTFDTFVVGTSNRFTHAAALAVAESPADAYNPLFIYGGVGLGKTHLLNAIGNHILKNKGDASIVYVSSERFTNELINAVRYDKIDTFREIYRTADVLVIDDIQFLAGKESTQEEFFHTFNTLYNAHKQIVVSSDRPPKDIPKLEERLRSRFEGGLITDIQPPSLETKVIILRREAKKQGMDPPDEVIHHIASKVKTNIRELRGYLTKIFAYSSLTKQEITMELAEDVLKDLGVTDEAEEKKASKEAAKEEAPAKKEEVAAAPAPKSDKQTLSSIEERLSNLKRKLSPILTDKKGGDAAASAAAPNVKSPSTAAPRPQADDTPVAQPIVQAAPEADVGDDMPEELAKCGNCGAIVNANVPECPECGVSFGGEWFECPECRSVVSSDSLRCDNCGAEFEAVGAEDFGDIGAGVPQQPTPAAVDDKKKKKKKKKKK